MSELTNVGAILINEALPPELQQDQHDLNKKSIHKLFMALADKHPDTYKEVLHKLSDVGRTAAWTEGASISLGALRKSEARDKILDGAKAQVKAYLNDDSLTDEDRNKLIVDHLLPLVEKVQKDVFKEGELENSPYAMQLKSGARGKPGDLSTIKGADLLATDARDRFMPVPLWKSYAEGYTPAQYFAAAFSQRKGALNVKLCLSSTTEVLMGDYSTKQIQNIRPGDEVFAVDSTGTRTRTKVANVFFNGPKECYTYSFAYGQCRNERLTVTCTPDHKFWGSWWDTKNAALRPRPVGMHAIGQPKTPGSVFKALPAAPLLDDQWGVDEPWALFAGLAIGDGNCTDRLAFSCGDPLLISDTAEYFAKLGIQLTHWGAHYGYGFNSIVPQPIVSLRGPSGRLLGTKRSNPAVLAAYRLGLMGHYSDDKELPEGIDTWNNRSVAACIAGIMSTDGCLFVSGESIYVCLAMTSHAVVSGVKRLLKSRFGIECSPVRDVKLRACMRLPQYAISITQQSSVALFNRFIKLVGAKRLKQSLALRDGSKTHAFYLKEAMFAGTIDTYDIEVEHPEHRFVLASGLTCSNSVGDAGYLNKRISNAAHRFVVSKDKPDPTRLPVGLPVPVSDNDNIGAVLARDAGNHTAGTLITPDILNDLKDSKIDDILIHSAMVEPSEDGGISAYAAGRRTRSGLAQVGDNIGLPAAQAIGERLAQGSLGAKHSGTAKAKAARSGMEYLNRLLDAPEHFAEAGPLATEDGMVEEVRKAPQGGNYIKIKGTDYYSPAGLDVLVKPGQHVEHGDDLTDGVPHPAQLVKLRGLGEARRVFTNYFREALQDSGAATHRRNIEPVVGGLMNWATVTNPDGVADHVYGDTVPFNRLAYHYKPRATAKVLAPNQAIGKYLEEPALHYTPGTRITKKNAAELSKWGIADIYAHDDPPDFEPTQVRSALSVYHDPDWRTRLVGFYTGQAFQNALHRGAQSTDKSTSYVPAITKPTFGDELDTFGKYGSSDDNEYDD